MIQDIYPHRYDNTYITAKPEDEDLLIICRGQKVIAKCGSENCVLPTVQTAEKLWNTDRNALTFLFRIDDKPYFLLNVDIDDESRYADADGYRFEHVLTVRGMQPMYTAFAAAVGAHLAHWYTGSRFCGRCGHRNIHAEKQRAMVCPECGQVVFPRINPIMIVAVTDGDKLLVAKYNRMHFDTRNNHYVLLAGYVEVGESYEDTLRREVREETGLEVRNIRYIGSQPWPFSDTSIAGFYAEADSTLPLKKQEDELSELKWLKREEVPARVNLTSITDNLIEWFRHGKTVEEILEERDKLENG